MTAGAAAIAQSATATTIDQTSQRAAINWRSFDVGSQQSVLFNQPSIRAVTLNRVIGPDPSQIAGRITANGQVIIVNQSGVTFFQGAQVNTSGLMVTAAGIGDGAFMAGSTIFDQPAAPNARIVNSGTITIANAGLAALVAPSVANSGIIDARMGHVILAGAQTATLDLYGDGLISLDVTNQVTQGPSGGQALVTNTGVIKAHGGTVQLTARAADGVVSTLVQAGGTIKAANGTVVLNGVGGNIIIEGQLSAAGGNIEVAPTGTVAVAATARISTAGKTGGGTVAIGTTLARARGGPSVTPAVVSANVTVAPGAIISADATQQGNGGTVTLLSAGTTVMNGSISAKGGPAGGNGGSVEISGGTVGFTGIVDTSAPLGRLGTLLFDPFDLYISDVQPAVTNYAVQAADLPTIAAGGASGATSLSWVSPAALEASTGFISLTAVNDIFVASSFGTANTLNLSYFGSLTLTAGRNLTIDRGFTISAGTMNFTATSGTIALGGSSGVTAGLISQAQRAALAPTSLQGQFGTSITMNAGSGIALADSTLGQVGAPVFSLSLSTGGGGVTQSANGVIVANEVYSANGIVGTMNLPSLNNAINSVDFITVTGGDLAVVNNQNMTIAGPLSANNLFFEVAQAGATLTLGRPTDGGTQPANLTAGSGGRVTLVADNYAQGVTGNTVATTAGSVELAPFSAINTSLFGANGLVVDANFLATIQTAGGTIDLGGFTNVPAGATTPTASASSVTIDGPANLTAFAATLRMDATGSITQPGGPITVNNVLANGASVTLTDPGNAVNTAGGSASGTFSFSSSAPLGLTNIAAGASATIIAPALAIQGTQQTPVLSLTATAGGIDETGSLLVGILTGSATGSVNLTGFNQVATLGTFSASSFTLNNASDLTIADTLTAPTIAIRDPANQVVFGDGATIVTGGTARPSGPIQLALTPTLGGPGAFIQAASFVQVGTSTVVGTGGGPATLQIATTGNMQFDPPLGLDATSTWLILNLTQGTANGNVYVKALDVSYTKPGSTKLFGTIDGISGGIAAASGFIRPAINNLYRFNNCVIESPVCSPLTDLTSTILGGLPGRAGAQSPFDELPILASLQFLMLPEQPGDWVDPDVVPPNISFVDY